MKETYKLGHPADCNHKRTVQAKNRENEIKKERGSTNPRQKRIDCLFKINRQYPNHHRNIKAATGGIRMGGSWIYSFILSKAA